MDADGERVKAKTVVQEIWYDVVIKVASMIPEGNTITVADLAQGFTMVAGARVNVSNKATLTGCSPANKCIEKPSNTKK